MRLKGKGSKAEVGAAVMVVSTTVRAVNFIVAPVMICNTEIVGRTIFLLKKNSTVSEFN